MRFFKFLVFNAMVLVCAANALGQLPTSEPSARFRPLPEESGDEAAPFFAPNAYEYDAQVFAPYDYRDLTEPDAPVGFYFTYDRIYTSVSRPGAQLENSTAFPTGNDFMWGNRFEGGVMTDNDSGWGFEYTRTSGSFFSWGQDELIANPLMTTTGVHNLKLNRTFRQRLSNGGWLEPYFGMRYFGLNDKTIEDTQVTPTTFNRFKQDASNAAIGGHVGARYVQRSGRWGVTMDGSLASAYNKQRYFATDLTFAPAQVSIFEGTAEDNSFIPAIDWRTDISYAITRDLALRGGVQILYLWDGVNRANTLTSGLNPNSALGGGPGGGIFEEGFITAGFNFGVEWRR